MSTPASPSSGRKGMKEFLRGPKVSDRRGLVFLLAIFITVASVFGIVYYTWVATHPTAPSSPLSFTPAAMSNWNASFSVASVEGGPYPWGNFTFQFTFNNFNSNVVHLAPSGVNASVIIGTEAYHIRWTDTDHDGTVSVGDGFSVTGDAGLAPLSYCAFSLIWDGGAWSSTLYWTTSSPND